MDHDALLNTFQNSRLFQGLSRTEMTELFSLAQNLNKKYGETLMNENDTGDSFFYIHAGRLEIQMRQTNSEENLVVNQLRDGDVVGEMVLLGLNVRSASVVIKSDAELLMWRAQDCLALFEKNRNLGFVVLKNLALILGARVRDMNMMLRSYSEVLGPDALKFL